MELTENMKNGGLSVYDWNVGNKAGEVCGIYGPAVYRERVQDRRKSGRPTVWTPTLAFT